MKKIFALVFLAALSLHATCTHMTMPTNYALVTNGTRANLKANFDEVTTRFNPCADSVDEVRARFSGYASSLLLTSLENLRLKLDGDGSTTTGRFLIEGTSGDSLFTVVEDSTAKFYGNLTVNKKLIVTDSARIPRISSALTLGQTLAVTGATTAAKITSSDSLIGTVHKGTRAVFSDSVIGIVHKGTKGVFSDTVVGANLKTSGSLTVTGNGTIAKLTASDTVVGANLKTAGSLTVSGNGTIAKLTASDSIIGAVHSGTKGVFSDSVVATLGLRIGSDTKMYRSATHTIKTDDSVIVAGNLGIGGVPGAEFHINRSKPAGTPMAWVENTSNTASSDAQILSIVGGTSAGDPYFGAQISSGQKYSWGIRNSASGDPWRLCAGANLGVTPCIEYSSAGKTTFPDSIIGTSERLTGTVTADSIISSKFYAEGTFTMVTTGCTTSPTVTAKWVRIGKSVTLTMQELQCTSNSTSAPVATAGFDIPAAERPSATLDLPIGIMNNTVEEIGIMTITSTGAIGIRRINFAAFTNTGFKGILDVSLSWTVQ